VREWVLFSYRLPREPSTPRIALWRRLRRLGALQLGDGLAGLPLDDDALEQCNWLATEVEEAGGEATVWTAQPSSKAEADALRQRLVETAAADYRAIVEASEAASGRRAALFRKPETCPCSSPAMARRSGASCAAVLPSRVLWTLVVIPFRLPHYNAHSEHIWGLENPAQGPAPTNPSILKMSIGEGLLES